ncbi:MAG: retropepsin-like aspartic protease [Polyangia bacterium]|jgi:clan AA aspartic protease (TIGR02281 family)|nr:retropepsin-like aspartic protease [Polyangia bacterium]
MTAVRQGAGKEAGKAAPPRSPRTPAKGRKAPGRPLRWLILALLWLPGLAILAGFFVLGAAYLAPIFGSGWLWVGATALFCLGLPLSVGIWLVRPLRGFKKAAWFTGTFFAIPLLGVLGLSLGMMEITSLRLQRHGRPLFERVFGPVTRSSTAREGSDLVARWAGLLHRPSLVAEHPGQGAATLEEQAAAAKDLESKTAKRSVFFTGVRRPPPPRQEAAPPKGASEQLRFLLRGGAIMLRGEASAARTGPVDLVLDTGASLSVLTQETARKLGLELPRDPVQTELDTAGGRRSFALAVLRRLRLGRASLDNVTVAICDECAPPGLGGLVGLNFTRHFLLSIDQGKRRITLGTQGGPRDRIADVEPFLELSEVTGGTEGERFAAHGKVRNRGPRAVLALRLAAELLDPADRVLVRYETVIPKIAPGALQPFRIEGAGHADLVKYRLEPSSARW